MEVIRFDGYTSEEKLAIAKGYLWPRQRDRNGLREDEVEISDEVLRTIIAEYTREAGVRNLERELGTVLRKTATKIASSQPRRGSGRHSEAEAKASRAESGRSPPRRPRPSEGRRQAREDRPGGRARCARAPEVLPGVRRADRDAGRRHRARRDRRRRRRAVRRGHRHEGRRLGGNGLVLTGQLGDVMKESARIALSYVRGHAEELGIDESAFENREFHVHVPAGAIPKDGPSAGVTMVTALASLLSGRPVKHTVGMTGEVTLQGRVLPIGGLKQKALAAHAAGLTDVILPERNRGDLDDIPEEVREQMTFHPVMTVQEVLDRALEPARDVAHVRRCEPVPVEVRETADLLERRWQLSIIYAALTGALRFNEFADAVAGISPRMLSERLRDLEAAGLVQRTVIPSSPPTVEYRLTARGRRLGPIIEAMRDYAREPV